MRAEQTETSKNSLWSPAQTWAEFRKTCWVWGWEGGQYGVAAVCKTSPKAPQAWRRVRCVLGALHRWSISPWLSTTRHGEASNGNGKSTDGKAPQVLRNPSFLAWPKHIVGFGLFIFADNNRNSDQLFRRSSARYSVCAWGSREQTKDQCTTQMFTCPPTLHTWRKGHLVQAVLGF